MRMRRLMVGSVCLAALVAILIWPTVSAVKADPDSGLKGVICHATGSSTNPYVGVIVGIGPNVDSPIFSNNGHLDESGSTLSGHEDDIYLGSAPPFTKQDCNKLPPPCDPKTQKCD